MSYEVVYTSARRGLRDGASGFCTVAATDGIPRLLHEKMESLSGYRHSEGATGLESPVNHSHVSVRIQRTVYHIVSRVADAGIDYTGRTNKIAHHLALTADEAQRFHQGPACMFADDAYWYTDWNGDPEVLPADRLPSVYSTSVNEFDTWQAVFGDAGWAGVLGQSVADGLKSVSIIVPNAEDTMALLHEAMQLVPVHQRWRVCFSTYFSRAAPGTECHWRFVMEGSSEARKLRARSVGLLVDPFGSSGKPPEESSFVSAARDGNPQQVNRGSVSSASRSNPPATSDSISSSFSSGSSGGGRRRSGYQRPHPASGAGRTVRRSPQPKIEYVEEYRDPEDADRPVRRRKKPKAGVWLVLFLLLAIIATLIWFGIQQF